MKNQNQNLFQRFIVAAKPALRRRGALPLACYLLALAVWLVLGAAHLGSDALAKAQGRLTEQALPLDELQLVDLTELDRATGVEDGATTLTLQSTSGDPQIIWEDAAGLVVRTVSYYAEATGEDPREICLYYTTAAGQDYSQDRRVFPQRTADGAYLFTLPRTPIVALRLDPCSPDANKTVELRFEPAALTINAAHTLPAWWAYFVPSWYQLFCLVLYPALAAAALQWLGALWRQSKGVRV